MQKSPMPGVRSADDTPASGPVTAAVDDSKAADQAKARQERAHPTVSEPGGFNNDPDDAANPNEAIERHRRKLRP
jgi:hypothetical protein